MTALRTHYDNLQVAENASPEVIKGAYKFLFQKWHPDKNPDNRAEAERISCVINEAYAVLADPQTRKEHDLWIRTERERITKQQRHDHTSPPPVSAATAPIGFFTRAWLMVLFAMALVMVLLTRTR